MARAEQSEFLVLVADDSTDDCLLIELAFRKMERIRFLGRLEDGDEAVAYLRGDGKYADREKHPIPDLLLLDLKMPRTDGFQVLRWLQSQSFPDLVVIVLSGSDHREDMSLALQLGAHHYHTKQVDLVQQIGMLKLFEHYLEQRNRRQE